MSGIIKLLPDSISSQIAAGEVIQRPASAVKELFENSIDAGSSSIKLIIKDAGKQLIQIIDNGCGMSEMDARKCFEKHATSKIRSIDDLFAILTMGFRGEALASVAAVAQVELKTKRKEDELGTRVVIEGSEIKVHEPCQTPDGTSISIKNLFFNIPARRNFLKSNPVETRHIVAEFQRAALANPDLQFEMFNNGDEVFHLVKGNLRQRIQGIFGKNYNERLVPMEEETDGLKVYGFVGKPEHAKKTRGEQYFFVNKRFIKNAYLNHAVFNVYQDYISKDSYPFFVLFVDMDPAKVDINVHPTKTEVKFEDDRLIYTFLNAGVKHALGQYNITPTLDFNRESGFDSHSSFRSFPGANSNIETSVSGAGKRTADVSYQQSSGSQNKGEWEELYRSALEAGEKLTVTLESKSEEELIPENAEKPETRVAPVQIHNKFILSQIRSGFILINQQYAHERVLFERYQKQLEEGHSATQRQLFPEKIELNEEDKQVLVEILPDINKLGFDIQEFGHNTFVIQGTPADIPDGDEKLIIEQLIEQFKRNTQLVSLPKRDNLARSLAFGAAIKAGKALQQQEMTLLIDELFACQNPYIAPNGNFVFVSFDMQELDKRFENQ